MSVAAVALAVAVAGGGAAVATTGAGAGQESAGGLLVRGSQGPAVATVQRSLGISATGVFGRETETAVRGFQRKRGLLVDGIVGPQTRAALGLGGPRPSGAAGGGATGRSTPAPAPAGAGAGAGAAGLQRIAQCESGGNPRAIGGGGRYRGKYQFTYETWRGVGGSGDPAAASEAEQDRRAAALYARSGTSSWPSCG